MKIPSTFIPVDTDPVRFIRSYAGLPPYTTFRDTSQNDVWGRFATGWSV